MRSGTECSAPLSVVLIVKKNKKIFPTMSGRFFILFRGECPDAVRLGLVAEARIGINAEKLYRRRAYSPLMVTVIVPTFVILTTDLSRVPERVRLVSPVSSAALRAFPSADGRLSEVFVKVPETVL